MSYLLQDGGRHPEVEEAADDLHGAWIGAETVEIGAPALLEAPLGRDFVLDLEGGVDAGEHGEEAQQRLAETVNRRDMSAVEPGQGNLYTLSPFRVGVVRELRLEFAPDAVA